MLQRLTSPSTLNSEDLPQPLGPQTRTLTPEFTSNDMLSTNTSPFGVTKGTSSNLKPVKRYFVFIGNKFGDTYAVLSMSQLRFLRHSALLLVNFNN